MVHTFPMTLPASLVEAHRVDLASKPSDGWRFAVFDVATAASGDTYVLGGARRYRTPAQPPQDPAERNFTYGMVTRHAPDGTPVDTALFAQPHPDGSPSAIPEAGDMTLAVLPDGQVALSEKPGSTFLLSADLSRVTESWRMPFGWSVEEAGPGDPYAVSLSVTPSGRLLAVTSEYGLSNWAGAHANIVAVSEPGSALAPGAKPPLNAIASLDDRTDRQTDADLRPYVRYQGAPVGGANRPSPSLTELVSSCTRRPYEYRDCWLGRPAPLGDELFVVPVFSRIYRSGNRGGEFTFALLDDQGRLTGRLEGLDLYKDSPFTGFCFTVAGDPHRGRAFHLNRYGLYGWTSDGQMRARTSTEDEPFKALTHFALMGCAPAGELLLVHRKQNLLLRVPVPEDLGDLPAALEDALRTYGTQRTALKKRFTPVNWHWAEASARVHRL
ncbi:hypothetical protein [Streptomyces katrae]|uniref:hypothetical protein n=1 Tax=Streptomyces katrae TaxID=68223 RepID=UPI0004C2A186|nr:hypothetical protein [Streptomyces katrae]